MINYINLTSGLEWVPYVKDYKLCYIKSSHLESGALWKLIHELDYGFLIDAALHGITLYDCGSRNGAISRAQWMGIPWIEFVYEMANAEPDTEISVEERFQRWFYHTYYAPSEYKENAKKKLRYVARLTGKKEFPLIDIVCRESTFDGNVERLGEFLK